MRDQIGVLTNNQSPSTAGRPKGSPMMHLRRPRRRLSPEEEVEAVRRLLGVMPRWRDWLAATYGVMEARDLRIDLWCHPQGTIYQIAGRRYWACDLRELVERVERMIAGRAAGQPAPNPAR